LYVASDALLGRIADFAKAGGHVLLTLKSGFTNEWSTVRWTRAPGPLREAAGISYQEFSGLKEPLPLRGDPFRAGPENRVSVWADMVLAETAKPLAFYDHPFFGRYPALTRNAFGKGTVTYQGTVLSAALQERVVADVLRTAGIVPEAGLPARVRSRQAVGRDGRALRFYLNFSGEPQALAYAHGAGTELLSQKAVAAGERLTLAPWDLAVVRE
ncbi:MAG TPA: beta-galactosidase trimerization domain-containing protein, partial [Vicinamibacteria bacterium]|nr:beta-galactosidase trimerization domain-containing protein [Vicinamibacteria bacterium]